MDWNRVGSGSVPATPKPNVAQRISRVISIALRHKTQGVLLPRPSQPLYKSGVHRRDFHQLQSPGSSGIFHWSLTTNVF